MPRHQVGHKQPLEPEHVEAIRELLAKATDRHAARNRALFAVWYDSFVRIEDLCGLSVGEVAGKDAFTIFQGKVSMAQVATGRRRKRAVTCYLQPRTMELVAEHLAGAGKRSPDPLFTGQGRNHWMTYTRTSTNGTTYTTRVGMSCEQVRSLFKAWCKAIGLDASLYSTHSVRRGRITTMWRNGVRPRIIQKLAGHEDGRTTMAYDTPTDDEMRDAALTC